MKPKFVKLIPKESWSKEKTQEQIARVKKDMATLSRYINKFKRRSRCLKEDQEKALNKMKDKSKYLTQLIKQLNEIP